MKKGAYAVIFPNRLTDSDPSRAAQYASMADRMEALAAEQPGYLGHMSVRGENGEGITVSYWESVADIAAWKSNAEHTEARRLGRDKFYKWFRLEVAKIERMYDFEN